MNTKNAKQAYPSHRGNATPTIFCMVGGHGVMWWSLGHSVSLEARLKTQQARDGMSLAYLALHLGQEGHCRGGALWEIQLPVDQTFK